MVFSEVAARIPAQQWTFGKREEWKVLTRAVRTKDLRAGPFQ